MTCCDRHDLCDAGPAGLLAAEVCLSELSVDVAGRLSRPEGQEHQCPEDGCRTLTTEQDLELELRSHDCASEVGRLLDGRLGSVDLVTVYTDGDGNRRGVHTATFTWRSRAGVVHGTLSGLTNQGTHRAPAFDACQRCGDTGVMEGRLCGRLVRAGEPRLAGAEVVAAYRLRFDASSAGAVGGVRGTLEGLVVRACAPAA
ncbi:hypothetical protein SAMN05660690_3935 [Geodermatophilus telluris]|uniref:Uncharacterized protein n=1 Tax=Geodermatophilus telluris TaxID=1190417 RepID=A0A1G6TLU1_9ACTN|nr:hypothetical protein [Geodermatophilus telluris]SDD30162.1 hypothetical protein SAMN05660690_3935 [Geodermatophilus telluris]